jgi:hypothetical protein
MSLALNWAEGIFCSGPTDWLNAFRRYESQPEIEQLAAIRAQRASRAMSN